MSTSIILMVLVALSETALSQGKETFFRKDYHFIPETSSFYKIHTIEHTWLEAKRACENEGATLFYPEDDKEAEAVIEYWNESQPFSFVYIGVSSRIAKEVFVTTDGKQIEDVYHNFAPGEPNNANGSEDCIVLGKDGLLNDDNCIKNLPFICKKTLASLQWNEECDIPYPDYVYNETLHKCYKFHLNPMNWTEAYAACAAEESYLAILNSKQEDEYLIKLIAEAPKDNIAGNYLRGAVHLGFLNADDEGWKTIKGTPLQDTGFGQWEGTQPDGGDNETCGSMFYTGQLNDIGCFQRCFFICEHDVTMRNEIVLT